jgi:hypothetical protein
MADKKGSVTITRHHFYATTTSPALVTEVITSDQRLQAKTELAVIDRVKNSYSLSLYRRSGKKTGWYSRDVYVRGAGRWVYSHKDPGKYPTLPEAPCDVIRFEIGPVSVWTRNQLTPEEMEETQRLVLKDR